MGERSIVETKYQPYVLLTFKVPKRFELLLPWEISTKEKKTDTGKLISKELFIIEIFIDKSISISSLSFNFLLKFNYRLSTLIAVVSFHLNIKPSVCAVAVW